MFSRNFNPPENKSYFLFGPRGTGKSTWVRSYYPHAQVIDLLESDIYLDLLASPQRLEQRMERKKSTVSTVIIDEVQKIPELLNEVHRLIEKKRIQFILTGSSARKLRRTGTNLLAGRALTKHFFPLTRRELGSQFDLKFSLKFGNLPAVWNEKDPAGFLKSYLRTYLREEIQEEGLTRNLPAFSRFLEAASFSQAQVLNLSRIAEDCRVERKTVENYFTILEDLLIAKTIPVFSKRAKRKLIKHKKFFFFDVGVYRALRPAGPLDTAEEIDGPAIETLLYQEISAEIEYNQREFEIYYWRTQQQQEIDLILYGNAGLIAIEAKRSAQVSRSDLHSLALFLEHYPMAQAFLITTGFKSYWEGKIRVIGIQDFLDQLPHLLSQ